MEIDNLRFSMHIEKKIDTIPALDHDIMTTLKETMEKILPDL